MFTKRIALGGATRVFARPKTLLILTIAYCFSAICNDVYSAETKANQNISVLKAAKHAMEEIHIGDSTYMLSVHVWRNFMPTGTPVDGDQIGLAKKDMTGLNLSIQVKSLSPQYIPPDWRIDTMWVFQQDRSWTALLPITQRALNDTAILQATLLHGPDWATGEYVDVVVRIVDSKQVSHLLASRHLEIIKTI